MERVAGDHDVAMIGCGLLGSAFARALARAGHSTVAWNRTSERAEALSADGIEPVRSVAGAVRSARLVVTCIANYQMTREALAEIDGWDGKGLVNLSTGVPEEAEEMEAWAVERGARYLDGAALCGPRDAGSPDAVIFYAGSQDVWSRHRQELLCLGGASSFISEQSRMAMVAGLAAGAFHVGALSAFLEAATYMHSQGVGADLILQGTGTFYDHLPSLFERTTAAIANDDHVSDQATVQAYAEAMRSALTMIQESGQPGRVSAAALANLDAAEAAGLGGLGFSAQARVMGVNPSE